MWKAKKKKQNKIVEISKHEEETVWDISFILYIYNLMLSCSNLNMYQALTTSSDGQHTENWIHSFEKCTSIKSSW